MSHMFWTVKRKPSDARVGQYVLGPKNDRWSCQTPQGAFPVQGQTAAFEERVSHGRRGTSYWTSLL